MRKTSSKSLFQTLQNLIRQEKKILNPVRLLSIWEKQRLHEFLKHLDPYMLILTTGIIICIILTGIFAYAFLNQTGVFRPPLLDPVMDFRISDKYYTKPLSEHFGLFDDQSKIWLGTKGDGIHEYAFDTKIWNQYTQKSTHQQLTGDYVEEILPDSKDIWIRAGNILDKKEYFGLSKFNIANETWQTLIGTQTFPMTGLDRITAIESGGENITWVGTDRFGLNRYNTETRTWEINEPPLFGKQITSLRKNKHALFAGATKGLFKIEDIRSAGPKPHTFFTNRYIQQLEQDGKKQVIYYLSDKGEIGQIYGNSDHAEKLINEETNFYKYNKLYINDNEITAVDDDKQGNFWIGTREIGLAFYDKNHHAWKGFNTSNTKKFPSNRTHAVTSGEWGVAAGTEDGLFIMDSSWESKQTFFEPKTVSRVEQGKTNGHKVLWGKTSLLSKKPPSKTLSEVKTKRVKIPLKWRKKTTKQELSTSDKNRAYSKKQQEEKTNPNLAENTIEHFQFKKNASVKTASHTTFIGRNLVRGLKPHEMICAVADKHSQVWVGTEGKGILVYKLDRRDWVRHQYIFQKSDFLDLMHIRYLAIKNDDISYIYLVTMKGGVGRFQPISVMNSSGQEKIFVEVIIHEGGKNMGKVSDIAMHEQFLYVARQNNGIVAYHLDDHQWKDITSEYHILYFQKDKENLYGLTTTGIIIQLPEFFTVPVPENEPVDEFYIQENQFIIKTRNGKLILNNKILIPNTRIEKGCDTEDITSVAMDNTTGNVSRIWIGTENCLGLYNIKAHTWEKTRHFNHHVKTVTYTSGLLSKRLWVHTKEKTLFLLDAISFEQITLIPAIESITFIDNKAFAIRQVNNEKELVQISSNGKDTVIISATAFDTVNQEDIRKTLWDSNQNFLFLGANRKVGRYAHYDERTWDSQNIKGNALKMLLNNKLWVHTSENYLYQLDHSDESFPIELSIPGISDFTADTNPVSSDGYALYANHDLKMISPQKRVPIIDGQASFEEFPGNTDAIALTPDENQVFIASPSGLNKYSFNRTQHKWEANKHIQNPHVKYNGNLWSYGKDKLYQIDPVSLNPSNRPYEIAVHKTNLPVVGFGKNSYAVYKEPGGNVFKTREPGTEEMLIGKALTRKEKDIYDKEDIHRVFIHPNKRYLYFGAQKENRTAIGRYDIQAHDWETQPIKGKIKQFVLCEDKLWCLTEADELYGFESESTEFDIGFRQPDVTAVTSYDNAIAIVQNGSVKRFKQKFETLAHNNRIEEKNISVQQVALNSQYIFMGTRESLWKYDIKLHKWTPFKKAEGFHPKYGSPPQSDPRRYTDIILSDNLLVVLDSAGNLFILNAKNMMESEPVDTDVIKFQIASSNLYYLKPDGLYELSDFKNNLLLSRFKKRLFASNKSKIGYITYVKETSNALYFGSREGIVQKYLPDTHEWGRWLKFKSSIKQIDVFNDRLIVETMSNQLFIENKEIANNYIEWFAESRYIWILKKDGLYRFDMNLLKTDQILGKGKSCFSRLNRVVQCVRPDKNIYFLSKDRSLCSYNTERNQWENYPKVARKNRLPFEIKGHGKRRAFLTETGYIQFTDTTHVIDTNKMSPGQQVLNFELTDKDTFVLMSDRMLYQCPHNRSGANRCFLEPVLEKQYIPHNDLDMVLEEPFKRSGDEIFITSKNILLYDKSFRIWQNYSLNKNISGHIKLSLDRHYFLINGYLYRFEPSSVPSVFSRKPFNFESAFIAITSLNLAEAVKLKSVYCSKDTIIGLRHGKKLTGVTTRGREFVKEFDTALQKYLLKYFQQKTPEQDIGYTISSFRITSSNEWLLVLDIPFRDKLELGYKSDRSPQFEKKENIKFPKQKPVRIDNKINMITTSRGIRRSEDELLDITVDNNILLYKMKDAPYSQGTVYALISPVPRMLNKSEFESAQTRWINRKKTETGHIINQGNNKVKLTDTYSAKLGKNNKWTHDRYYSMEKIGNKLYIVNGAGIFQYQINSAPSALAFEKPISGRKKFISQPHISEVLEWDSNRLVRKDRFDWVRSTKINGRKLLIRKDKGKLKIKYDIKPEKDIWNNGFEWDRIHDFGIDSENRLWIGHPDSVMVYDLKDQKKLLSWFDQKNGVSDIMFHKGKGYFKASGKYYQLKGSLSNAKWKQSNNGSLYQTLQTDLGNNGIWKFKKQNGQLQIFFRNQQIQFQNGKFGIDQVNDLLYIQENQSLVWATDEGIYDSTRDILHYFEDKINKLRYHPVESSANKSKIITWKESIPYVYDPVVHKISQVSEKEQGQLDNILSESDNDQWKFRNNDKWKYDNHEITFKNGRFGFDTISHLLGDPIIFLTHDGIWEYQNYGDMKNWLSDKNFHKQGQRVFTSRYNPDKIYLETYEKRLFEKKGNQFIGPMSSKARRLVYQRENAILTDKVYNKWYFPSTSKQDGYHFEYTDNNMTYDVAFTNQRFGWDNIHDLEWVGNELHLVTSDGLVQWQFTEKEEWNLTQALKVRNNPPLSVSIKDMKRIFRSRINSSVFICKNESCSGLGFKWDGNQYQRINNASVQWNDSESTLLEQGYGMDWEFSRGNDKNSVQIRYKDHTGKYKPVTLEKGKFGFNRMQLISASLEQVLMITQESQEMFDIKGNSMKFELTRKVKNYDDLLNNIFQPEHWWVKTKARGYLWSKDGFDWKKGNNKDLTRIRDQFDHKILTDKDYPNWEFRSDKGFHRYVSGHDKPVRFTIQQGKMSFDMLALTGTENTIATGGNHVWYVTKDGNGILMDNEGKILYDFHPEESNYRFNHIYFKNWQKAEKALLAETESNSGKITRKWENKDWTVDDAEPSYTSFRKVLLKNDNWEVLQSNKLPDVKILPVSSEAYVPLTLSGSNGFLADHVNAIFPHDNNLYLATDEGIRILNLNHRGWDMHTYIKGEKQSVQDVRLADNRIWARFSGAIYCSDQSNQWVLEKKCKPYSPFATPLFSADNWEWYIDWNNRKSRYGLKLLSVKNTNIERKFDPAGNFSDNLVYDFDASGDKICVSSKFGVSLYDTEGSTVALYPKLSNAEILHQENWFFKYKNKVYMLPDNPIYPQDQPVAVKNNPFQKQILTDGWGVWYKDEAGTFSFELCNQPLEPPVFSKSGKFSFDIVPKIFVLSDQLWAAIPSGIIQYDLSDPLVIKNYFPCSLGNGDIRAVSLKGELYFVDKKYILDANKGTCDSVKTFQKKNADLWEKINSNIRDQAILSKDRLWRWERTENGFVVRYNENPEWKRAYSNGRFKDDQPQALYTLDKLLCYECPMGYYILNKNTLLVKGFKKSRPEKFKHIEPLTKYENETGLFIRLELRNDHKRVYLNVNSEPCAPKDKLWTLILRHDDFYAMGDRYFYQIHLPSEFKFYNKRLFGSLN